MRLTYTQTITITSLGLIFLGGFLLCLPISSRTDEWTQPLDAIFTAISAVSVTGLVLFDTFTHWSVVGQIIILLLIQIGGIGFMTVITMFSVFLKRKIGLHERQILVQSAGLLKLGGVVRLIKRIIIITLCIEAIGAFFLAFRFCPQMGMTNGIYYAVFHSISSFCNAGFDLMGKYGQFSSLTSYAKDAVVSLTVMLLIILGGMGFIVLDDIRMHRFNAHKYSLHTKITLSVSGMLILLGFVLFYVFENNGQLADFTFGEKIIASLFQSVTPRTAGYNSIDTSGLTEASVLLTIALMFIGGSSGSTAGGIKTSTLAILVMSAVSSIRRTNSMTIYKRTINDKTFRYAASIVSIYLFMIIAAAVIICAVEPVSLKEALFESTSALGTVGLSLGITPALGITAKTVITFLMFAGRLGWITLLLAFAKKHIAPTIKRPGEKILIG
jgi:trk system potassium uptake protein TrkH